MMYEITYFVGTSKTQHRSVVTAVNEVMARGLIRQHESHADICVVSCKVIPDNVVYMVY